MVWSQLQRMRLALEKEELEKYFRHGVFWIDPTEKTKVKVVLKSNSDKEYKLCIPIPADFPNSCPKLLVVFPTQLQLQNGSRLPQLSEAFHTLNDIDGLHRICHFYPPAWSADNTLYQIFMKGRLWIEAYEAHMRTGMKMDVFLGEMKFTPDPDNPWIPDANNEELRLEGLLDRRINDDTPEDLHDEEADPCYPSPRNFSLPEARERTPIITRPHPERHLTPQRAESNPRSYPSNATSGRDATPSSNNRQGRSARRIPAGAVAVLPFPALSQARRNETPRNRVPPLVKSKPPRQG